MNTPTYEPLSTAEKLEESGWTVQVPPRIGAELEAQGAPFSP